MLQDTRTKYDALGVLQSHLNNDSSDENGWSFLALKGCTQVNRISRYWPKLATRSIFRLPKISNHYHIVEHILGALKISNAPLVPELDTSDVAPMALN